MNSVIGGVITASASNGAGTAASLDGLGRRVEEIERRARGNQCWQVSSASGSRLKARAYRQRRNALVIRERKE